jgi:hypothetical protein
MISIERTRGIGKTVGTAYPEGKRGGISLPEYHITVGHIAYHSIVVGTDEKRRGYVDPGADIQPSRQGIHGVQIELFYIIPDFRLSQNSNSVVESVYPGTLPIGCYEGDGKKQKNEE